MRNRCLFAACVCLFGSPLLADFQRPNVILIMTDDQGYGDIAAHGNKMIQTPNIDKLWSQSVRLTDYHVDPTCSPTRSALMTGRYSTRTGVWHTIMGRSLMATTELTLAEVFAANGYATGIFGKWHLGDNYPCRPQDQGFQHVVIHGGGGVGQTPDFWGNDYFDDTYFKIDRWHPFKGYCTDVWFDEALKFIETNKDKPFFAYIPTNAPHGPYRVADKYAEPYRKKGVPAPMANFYGMITNIDENLAKLRRKLDDLGLSDNTLLIFTTDNGTAAGVAKQKKAQWAGFNAGMRGQKGSEYDGGHRVPCFFYWPKGGLDQGKDVDVLAAHIDMLPTLVDLCQLKKPDGPPIDGVSLKAALYGQKHHLENRTLFVHSQRIQHPEKWRKCAVMTKRWRFINGKELYDMKNDPGQSRNVAAQHPDLVKRFTANYEAWWESLKPAFEQRVRITIGNDAQNPARLSAHDWHIENAGQCPWNQSHVRSGVIGNGPWAIYVDRAGTYEFTLWRIPGDAAQPMQCTKARVAAGGQADEKKIDPQDKQAVLTLRLPKGPCELQNLANPF